MSKLGVRYARGFTLVEVLLALLVLSVGLLGAAAMLLGSLRGHARALQRLEATQLVRDMADRIRANALCRAGYVPDSADGAHFESAARALFPHGDFTATVEFAPATGPAAPDRYLITLDWRGARDADDFDGVALQVLAQPPVAG